MIVVEKIVSFHELFGIYIFGSSIDRYST